MGFQACTTYDAGSTFKSIISNEIDQSILKQQTFAELFPYSSKGAEVNQLPSPLVL
jgi:hypothetical protein